MTTPRQIQAWIVSVVLLLVTWNIHAQTVEYKEGQHFFLVPAELQESEESKDEQSGATIEVLEFFSYTCPACKQWEGFIKNWLERKAEDVVFRREHVIFSQSSVPLARAYYLAEDLKVLPKIHDRIFEAIHRYEINLTDEELLMQLFKNAAKVDNDTFKDKYWAQETQDRIRQGHRKVRTWQISATPTFVVGKKYVITTESAGRNPRKLFQIVDFLADKIRAESKKAKPVEST
ncbi:MAG: thiol:disulfide interchange protein DsbA/DsbL [Gammaproteobacteria bacterium]|nr:thiol:disulfide interchange protein DsbA/DsbL [Gammaproteobacteria bacterium]